LIIFRVVNFYFVELELLQLTLLLLLLLLLLIIIINNNDVDVRLLLAATTTLIGIICRAVVVIGFLSKLKKKIFFVISVRDLMWLWLGTHAVKDELPGLNLVLA